jgi:hypothetical protein
MQFFLDNAADVLDLIVYVSAFLYAPFSSTWRRAVLVPGLLAVGWSALRLTAIIRFGENSPPGIGFLIFPVMIIAFASAARLLKLVVFRIPLLAKWERQVRAHDARS